MPDILHRIGIRSTSLQTVYNALTTRAGLSGWWTSDTLDEGNEVGQVIRFRFGEAGFDMVVRELQEPHRVVWEVLSGHDEWIGTQLSFELKQEGDFVIVLFKHLNWQAPVAFMHHCSTKWAIFLMSLKALIETGTGKPHPVDVKIDNWN